jgi:hypothetical protein
MPQEKRRITREDFDRMTPREAILYVMPALRHSATRLGNFKTCRLSQCRRAKKCSGRHPDDKIATDHWTHFPPCVQTGDAQSDLMAQCRRTLREIEAEALKRGIKLPEC